jgi:hypothetical protein
VAGFDEQIADAIPRIARQLRYAGLVPPSHGNNN